jgi:hypothetical protein
MYALRVYVHMLASKPVCKEIIVRIIKSRHLESLGHVAKLDKDKEFILHFGWKTSHELITENTEEEMGRQL